VEYVEGKRGRGKLKPVMSPKSFFVISLALVRASRTSAPRLTGVQGYTARGWVLA
jgi:hypothetical protein